MTSKQLPNNGNYYTDTEIADLLGISLGRLRNKLSAAQNRYEELTGWKCPAAGGPDGKTLTPEQKEIDRQARLTISRELGHEREAVVGAYVGR